MTINLRIATLLVSFMMITGCNFKSKEELAHTRWEVAKEYGLKNDFQTALKILDEIVMEYPDFAPAHFLRGSYLRMVPGKTSEAIASLSKAIELQPEYTAAYKVRGELLVGFDGLADLDKAIELDSTYAEAFYARADRKLQLNNYFDALDDYNKAIELNSLTSNKAKSTLYSGRARTKFELVDYDGMLTDINLAISLDSTNALNYRIRHYYYGVKGQLELAERDYNKSVALGLDSFTHKHGIDSVPKFNYRKN